MVLATNEHARLLLEWCTIIACIGATLLVLRHQRHRITRSDGSSRSLLVDDATSSLGIVQREVSMRSRQLMAALFGPACILNALIYALPSRVCLTYSVVMATVGVTSSLGGYAFVSMQLLPMHGRSRQPSEPVVTTAPASTFAALLYILPVVQLSVGAVVFELGGALLTEVYLSITLLLVPAGVLSWAHFMVSKPALAPHSPLHRRVHASTRQAPCHRVLRLKFWLMLGAKLSRRMLFGAHAVHRTLSLTRSQRRVLRQHSTALIPAMQMAGIIGQPVYFLVLLQSAVCIGDAGGGSVVDSVGPFPGQHMSRQAQSAFAACHIPGISRPPDDPTFAKLLTLMLTSVFAVILVSTFAWEQALFDMASHEQRQQQAETTAMLRWLSHECRSPVAAAMLSIEYIADDVLPAMRELLRACAESGQMLRVASVTSLPDRLGSSPLHTQASRLPPSSSRPSGAAFALGAALQPAEDEGSETLPLTARQQPSKAQLQNISLMAQHLAELDRSLGMVNQPVKGLSEVLDNMLLYMRRQREGYRGIQRAPTRQEDLLDVASALELARQSAFASHDVEHSSGQVNVQVSFASALHRHSMTGAAHGAVHGSAATFALQQLVMCSTITHATIMQVLTNYLTNALKYGKGHDGVVDVAVRIRLMPVSHSAGAGHDSLRRATSLAVAPTESSTHVSLSSSSRDVHEAAQEAPQSEAAPASAAAPSPVDALAADWMRQLLGAGRAPVVAQRDPQQYRTLRSVVPGVLHLAVQDQGTGLSAREVSSLFQPFARLRAGAQAKGNGLGLWLMKELMESQGGSLGVSSPGKGYGSTFTAAVPVLVRAKPKRTSIAQVAVSPTHRAPQSSLSSQTSYRSQRAPPPPQLLRLQSQVADGRSLVPLAAMKRCRSETDLQALSKAAIGPAEGDRKPKIDRADLSPLAFDFEAVSRTQSLDTGGGRTVQKPIGTASSSPSVHTPQLEIPERISMTASQEWHVLIVDDAAANRTMLARQVKRKGHRVATAEDGIEGLKYFLAHASGPDPVHIIITDFTMPRMDGGAMAGHIVRSCAPGDPPSLYSAASSLGNRLSQAEFKEGSASSTQDTAPEAQPFPRWIERLHACLPSAAAVAPEPVPPHTGAAAAQTPEAAQAEEGKAETQGSQASSDSSQDDEDHDTFSLAFDPKFLPRLGVATSASSLQLVQSPSTPLPVMVPARRHRPVIIGVTGNAMADDVAKFEAAGADVVLIKPVATQKLLATAASLLARRAQLRDASFTTSSWSGMLPSDVGAASELHTGPHQQSAEHSAERPAVAAGDDLVAQAIGATAIRTATSLSLG